MADHDLELFLVVFDEKSFSLSSELYGDIDEFINDNYVEEKSAEEYAGSTTCVYDERPRSSASFFMGNALAKAFKSDSLEKIRKRKGAAKEAEAFADIEMEDACAMGAAPMAAKSLDDVIKNLDKSFMELVFSFADEKGMTDVQIQKKANLDRKAFSKLKCGTTKNPSKSTALALAVALELNLDETRDLLSRAGLALSPCSKQDVIVQYFIEREAYDIYEINIALFEHGEQLLGSQAS